jgi:predicted nucleic acid-binding protein
VGGLALPEQGTVYLDANSIIYSVERIEPYRTALQPLWEGARAGKITIATSDLTLLEVLVVPLRTGNKVLEAGFRALLQHSSDVVLIGITHAILEWAASLRASMPIKTPDAIHAATALQVGCELFVTNDVGFRRVPGLPVVLLSEALPPQEGSSS